MTAHTATTELGPLLRHAKAVAEQSCKLQASQRSPRAPRGSPRVLLGAAVSALFSSVGAAILLPFSTRLPPSTVRSSTSICPVPTGALTVASRPAATPLASAVYAEVSCVGPAGTATAVVPGWNSTWQTPLFGHSTTAWGTACPRMNSRSCARGPSHFQAWPPLSGAGLGRSTATPT